MIKSLAQAESSDSMWRTAIFGTNLVFSTMPSDLFLINVKLVKKSAFYPDLCICLNFCIPVMP